MNKMKIVTWNINGLRSGWEQFYDFLKSENPDVVCLQEIKVDESRLPKEYREPLGYKSYWHHAQKPGYSGVAIYSKIEPIKIIKGINSKKFDDEGRVITADFGKFSISNWYFPHSSRDLKRMDFKLEFNSEFEKFMKRLNKTIICGDFNVAHQEIDLARPKDNVKNAGFTPVEREWMDKFLADGFVDAYREFNPSKQEFTWWSQRFGARKRNVGWRIDYFLVPGHMVKIINKCTIEAGIYGSDHCPVVLESNL